MTLVEDPAMTAVAPNARRTDRLMGGAAVGAATTAFAVLLVPHAILDPTAPTSDEVTTFFTENYTMQQFQPLMHSISGVLLLFFLVRLAALLHELDAGRSADVVRAAATAIAAVIVVTMGWVAAVVTLTGNLDGSVQWALYNIGWDLHFRLLYLLPLVLLPAGWSLRRTGAPVLGWTTVGLGVLTVVAPLGYLGKETWFVQYPAYMLFLLWALAAGIALGFRGVRQTG